MNADLNLLFGMLALHNGFIDRQALVAAFDRWINGKSQPLAEILLQAGALTADERALLEGLVAMHLAKFGNEAAKSLSALSPIPLVREELERIGDDDLRAGLDHVSQSALVDPLATLPVSVGAVTSAGLRFRVLRAHARGGLGEVYVAHDEELHREVALKQIQERHADHPDSRSRFLREAEITGGLEHPNIVPVYGLGCYGNGRPFYAMRFIRGDSLAYAVRAFHLRDKQGWDRAGGREIQLRKLLQRFLDVCNAVAYAHSRGVLHRDLKPGNVMLGKFGETLVVDWGLAKPLGHADVAAPSEEHPLMPSGSGSAAEPTRYGHAMGTPEYMSPEQSAGRLDELGPATDVYSLGATLYELLTGKPPFRRDDKNDGELLQAIQRGDFPRPRHAKASVPRALEAICLKAMALRPADRYASVQVLAADLEHWLADEPVAAYSEPWPTRLARSGRRHKTLVCSAAVLLVTAVGALTAGLVLPGKKQTEIVAEHNNAQKAKDTAQVRLFFSPSHSA